MIFNNYLSSSKIYLFKFLTNIDNNKVIIYSILFFIYFILYYAITIPQQTIDSTNNPFLNKINEFKESELFIFIISIINVIFIIIIVLLIYYYKKTNKFKRYILLLNIILISGLLYFNALVFGDKLNEYSDNKYFKLSYYILSSIFYLLFVSMFIFNINTPMNEEFVISIIIMTIFLIEYLISSISNIIKVYNLLKNNNYSELTINCFKSNTVEKYDNDNSVNQNIQIQDINTKYGDSYLKTIGSIPVSFYNKKNNNYQDLTLSDFYYPGSYYSYLSDTPLNGTPSLNAIKIGFQKFKTRVIHLDIFSDSDNEYSKNANPVVRCKNMSENATPLNFEETLNIINKWAWITDDPNQTSYPLFLYLNFEFNETNEHLYLKIYNLLLKYFSKKLVDKKYSYCGRNNLLPISKASIKECLNKIIITTNTYPTKTILDELINASNNHLNHNFDINLYKSSYITYDKVGLSQDNDKTELINNSKTNLNFYYTLPNEKNKNPNQPKAGLYNPSFQDCAQYGIQGTLMYIFLPDENLNNWVSFFKNKNNFDPVLKDELLRLVDNQKPIIKEQDPMIGLQKPQKYCLIPGMMATNKSNLSTKNVNISCN
jgi:hypothetical protein